MSKHGGKRTGAGRKNKADELLLIEQLDKHIDRDVVIQKLRALVDQGDFKAIQLYMNYLYGKPKETREVKIETEKPIIDL